MKNSFAFSEEIEHQANKSFMDILDVDSLFINIISLIYLLKIASALVLTCYITT